MVLAVIRQEPIKKNDNNNRQDGILFTEALTLTKFGKFNYFLIFISGMVLANVLLETAAIGFILPIAQCDLQLTNQDKGILSAIGFAGIIVSSHLWGFLADTKGRRKVIRPTLLAGFVVTVFSSFSHKFWMMVLLRFINGFFVSGGSATIYAYLGEFHTDKTRSRAMMGSSFIFALGAMILPLIAFLVINQDWILPLPFLGIDYKPWRFFLIVCGIPGFLCGISLYALPESPKFLLSIGQQTETIEVLQKMLRWNGSREQLQIKRIVPEEDLNHSPAKMSTSQNSKMFIAFLQTMWDQTVPLFHKKYLRTTLIVCTVQFWLYVITNGLYMWFPHIINSMAEFMNENPGQHKKICEIVYDKHESLYKTDGSMECITKLEDNTYFYSLVMEILYASSFAFIGLIINRVSKVTVLFIIMIFFSSCGLAAVFTVDPSITAYLYVLLFLVGVAINVLGATTVELYPTNLRAMAICISLMVGRLGSVVGANIVGALLGTHCELTFYIGCVALYCCAFLSLLIPRASLDEPVKQSLESA
ncbi:synaptic vesicle glycoprotein 2B-like isoform X2 [Teleopsis dalmanni]|uniref:synaptic vesicle glycoprotein 2B-like isoform X2 n=1 Tax=Teleopsis dalmanni TaxID=139649 RepID=UPI0018CF7465|nr:synaptic vesicle glycoprotein 2B-like isoform X2 [Teleopsis dalmanni]XP_037938043.1 synaptic vesicle glycoprotein 2B-like isoform X2 [Teleopsis dalmanni]